MKVIIATQKAKSHNQDIRFNKWSQGRFLEGVGMFINLKGFNRTTFLEKIKTFPTMLQTCLYKTEYVKMFCRISNYYNQGKKGISTVALEEVVLKS